MQQTSLLAYSNIKDTLGTKQRIVYDVLKRSGACCNQDLAHILGWTINSVTPRVLELREKGKVVEDHRDKHPNTNRTVIYWRVT